MRQEGKVFDFEFKKVDSHKIKAAAYQRLIKSNKVKKIVNDFDENLVNVVKVSFRDNEYWDFDGDHTVVSCKKHNNDKDLPIWCKVFYGMSYEDEAYYFAKQNGYSSVPPTNERLKALHESKDDDAVNDYECLLQCAGFAIDYTDSSSLENTPRCHNALFRYYTNDRDSFIDLIDVMQSAWHGDRTSFNGVLMNGLFKFVSTYRGKYDVVTLKKHLSKLSPRQIVAECKKTADTGVYKNARVILKIYNKGIPKDSNKRLKDDFAI